MLEIELDQVILMDSLAVHMFANNLNSTADFVAGGVEGVDFFDDAKPTVTYLPPDNILGIIPNFLTFVIRTCDCRLVDAAPLRQESSGWGPG